MTSDRPDNTAPVTHRAASERGAAMVEFALLLPLLIMLVFGIITFGRAYFAKVELASAVREGARAEALDKDPVSATVTAGQGLPVTDVQVLSTCTPGVDGQAKVKATYTFDFDIPLVTSGTKALSAIGPMRCGV